MGVGEKRIDRADLAFLNQRAQQPVPHHNHVQCVACYRAAIEIAHDRAVVLVHNFDVNAVLLLEVCDQSGLGKGIEKPFVSGQTKG